MLLSHFVRKFSIEKLPPVLFRSGVFLSKLYFHVFMLHFGAGCHVSQTFITHSCGFFFCQAPSLAALREIYQLFLALAMILLDMNLGEGGVFL